MFADILQKIRWHLNEWMLRRLSLLALFHGRLTVYDAYRAPGDTLLSAMVCRIIKQQFPGLTINLVTRWPELVLEDPALDSVNGPESYFSLRFWYVETVARKEREKNVLLETLAKVGVVEYEYRSRVYLTESEKRSAAARLRPLAWRGQRRLAICTQSKEQVKNWPRERWEALIARINPEFQIVHLGDDTEPLLEGVERFAGKLSIRESMGVLSQCSVFAGPDSFLMHAANGLDIPSVIIFGGARPSACLGYRENINLFVAMPCGPCWLHDSRGDICPHDIACMKQVAVTDVADAIERICVDGVSMSVGRETIP